MFHIIGQLITGLIVGAVAQILFLGNDPGAGRFAAYLSRSGSASRVRSSARLPGDSSGKTKQTRPAG